MIPAEAVEAAANEIYKVAADLAYETDTWDDLSETQRNVWLEDAKRILEAAAPHMLREAWEAGYMCSYDQDRGGSGDGHIPVPEHLTDDLMQWNPYRPTA